MMRRVSIPANTRRWPIIVIGILILLFIGFTVMSGFYVDLLWFREVELSSVFWSVCGRSSCSASSSGWCSSRCCT